jgi:hypothetical protein
MRVDGFEIYNILIMSYLCLGSFGILYVFAVFREQL